VVNLVTFALVKTSILAFFRILKKAVRTSSSTFNKIFSSRSMIVTFDPNVEKIVANSIPITPPPTITNDFGTSGISKSSLLVKTKPLFKASFRPGIGGIAGVAPVAKIIFLVFIFLRHFY